MKRKYKKHDSDINKLTDDTFQLADAGIGATSNVNFNRGIYANFENQGQGFQFAPEKTIV